MSHQPSLSQLRDLTQATPVETVQKLHTTLNGLKEEDLDRQRAAYGVNCLIGRQKDSIGFRLRRSFINPFSVVLMLLASISLCIDIFLTPSASRSYTTVLIITTMLLSSGFIRFAQEMKSKKIADALTTLTHSPIRTKRNNTWTAVEVESLVVGDLIHLEAGERVPADIRLIAAEECFLSEAVITGESGVQEKTATTSTTIPDKLSDYKNIALMGTTLINGSCEGIVVAVGENTLYGALAPDISERKQGFDRGSNSIAWVLIRFMLLLVPIVFIASGLTKGNWFYSFVFALSVAVGLTPELLPMVITACLAKGSFNMSKKQTVVKNINAMQGFGNMDVLCVDKTGTLTKDTLLLEYYMDILGNEDQQVLDCAYLNSYFHSGIKNHLDHAILALEHMPRKKHYYHTLTASYKKLDERPFDYQRKVSSVLLAHEASPLLIMKGDIESILKRCQRVSYRGTLTPIGTDALSSVHAITDDMLEDGMKVLAIATKPLHHDTIALEDEYGLTLLGYIAFFDAPQQSAASAITKLQALNVNIKVLTGDHSSTTLSICRRLGMPTDRLLTGAEFEQLSDNDAQITVENTSIFTELTPSQKAQIISMLQSNGHTVGYLADGVNDLPSVLQADVGISVETASPSVKEYADVLLLKKDLNVLEEGILEGRRAFANMSKYVKITASSNLGNILAIVFASIFLPFFPMTSIQILLLNLLYDVLCLVLPWDKVDATLCEKPLEWSGSTLSRFMLFFGPISSAFDIITFLFLFNFLCPLICGGTFTALSSPDQTYFISLFQTGWFLESIWTQTLILHLLRTKQLPFLQSTASRPVLIVTLLGICSFTLLAMTPVGTLIGMTKLPPVYFLFLIVTVCCYLTVVTTAKKLYLKHHPTLL